MLKIKDNIDLKELEKFGFELEKRNKQYWEYRNKKGTIHYVFMSRKMSIYMDKYPDTYNANDVLYDLIKADLVEKVEEK